MEEGCEEGRRKQMGREQDAQLELQREMMERDVRYRDAGW